MRLSRIMAGGASTLVLVLSGLFWGVAAANPVHFDNCDQARAAGAAPIHRGEPGYRRGLDRDGDGTACDTDSTDSGTPPATTTSRPAPTTSSPAAAAVTPGGDTPDGELAYTGAETVPLAVAGAGLLALGGGAVWWARRRART